jgi:uncharacterized protein (TIGR01319 family)
LDIGSVNTRAAYFDVVEGSYRFIAVGYAPTTAQAPASDVGLGIRDAVQNLQTILDRHLLDQDGRMIIPSQPEGVGVDILVATLSAGPAIKTALFGLLSEVSIESVQRLARSTYTRIVDTIWMNDKRKADEQIDSLLRTVPEIILIAGGTDGGASRSIQKMVEVIGLVSHIQPPEKRPNVLYAGNQELVGDVKTSLEKLVASLYISSNIRPSLEFEDLEPAEKELANMYALVRKQQIVGIEELSVATGGMLLPTAYAQGRMVRFLSTISEKGILSFDLGASSATVTAGVKGRLYLNVFPQYGLGEPLVNILRQTAVEDIMQWLPVEVSPDFIREYTYLKSLYPGTVPGTAEDLALEQAFARQSLKLALQAAAGNLPRLRHPRPGLLPNYDPIFLGGSIFSAAPTRGQALLMFLDAAQPSGMTTVMLDENNMLAMLGAAAQHNSLLPIHVMESGAIVNLATVISPISTANYGAPILRVKMTYDDGEETRVDVKQGALELIPLSVGRTAEVRIEPLGRTDVGAGPGRPRLDKVKGSALGLVIDGRGRPLRLPSDAVRRRELLKKWLWTVGG